MLIIALCGHPHVGKSTLQAYLEKRYGFTPCDDAAAIRAETMRRHDLSLDDVTIQSEKEKIIDTSTGPRSIRRLMADIADEYISVHGTQWKPLQALADAQGLDRACFASVRRDEGRAYQAAGGILIEITRPGCHPRTQADTYDTDALDASINNDGNLQDLFDKADQVVAAFFPDLAAEKRA